MTTASAAPASASTQAGRVPSSAQTRKAQTKGCRHTAASGSES